MKSTILRLVTAILVSMSWGGCDLSTTEPNPTPVGRVSDWSIQLTGVQEKLYDVYFINANQGWAVGEFQTVLSTTNAGTDWPFAPYSGTEHDLRSAFFLNTMTGYIAGGNYAAPIDGRVFVTKMGGAYPTEQKIVPSPLNTVFFLDDNHGWAAGDSSTLLHTDNAGDAWTQSKIGDNIKILDLQFLNSTTGWAVGSKGNIYRTKDGTTWNKDDAGISSDLYSVQFIDTLHAFACGAENKVLKRTVDSNNKPVWLVTTIPAEPVSQVWHDLFFITDKMGWLVGTGGAVYKTIDGGTIWTKESVDSPNDLYAIHMISATRGWTVGDKGTVMTYTP